MDYASIYAAERANVAAFATKRLLDGIGWRLAAKRITGLHSLHLEACLDAQTDELMKRGMCADVVKQIKGAGAIRNGGK